MSQDVMQEVIRKIIEFANTMLDQTKGGLIAGIGIIVLMYLIFKLLRNIERSFNDIWGVTHSRPIGRQLTDYLSVLFVAPILFILSAPHKNLWVNIGIGSFPKP
jgi:membrane protein